MARARRGQKPDEPSAKDVRGSELAILTIDEAGKGARVCIDTANRLIRGAKILSRSQLLELASFALCSAIEELGKAFLLMEFQEELFSGREDARERLRRSFYKHPDKLELALADWTFNKSYLDLLTNFDMKSKSVHDLAKGLVEAVETISVPDMNPLAQKVFDRRNELLYTNFKDGQFQSGVGQSNTSEYKELLDVALKGVSSAELKWILGMIVFQRGSSRRKVGELLRANLPQILEELKAKL
jgi:AbiV family abortive infection protein